MGRCVFLLKRATMRSFLHLISTFAQGNFLPTKIDQISIMFGAWISNYIYARHRDVIIKTGPNFNGALGKSLLKLGFEWVVIYKRKLWI